MNPTRTRRLTAAVALALGVALAPTAAGAATGLATPTIPPRPPAGPGGLATRAPLLTVELDDATEAAGAMEGRLRLSSPLDQYLQVDVGIRFPGAGPEDIACEALAGGGCAHTVAVEMEPGTTLAHFELDVVDDGTGGEDAELVGVEIESTHPATAVRTGPGAEAVLYDGDGLTLGLVDDAPEAIEGDPGTDGTLDLVVEADQALPHPVTFRVHSVIVGFGASPGLDYQPIDVVVELPAGETSATVGVPLVGDQLDESPYEIFMAHVGDPSHGEMDLSGGTAVPRIMDDDGPDAAFDTPGDYQSPSRSARSAERTA